MHYHVNISCFFLVNSLFLFSFFLGGAVKIIFHTVIVVHVLEDSK